MTWLSWCHHIDNKDVDKLLATLKLYITQYTLSCKFSGALHTCQVKVKCVLVFYRKMHNIAPVFKNFPEMTTRTPIGATACSLPNPFWCASNSTTSHFTAASAAAEDNVSRIVSSINQSTNQHGLINEMAKRISIQDKHKASHMIKSQYISRCIAVWQ